MKISILQRFSAIQLSALLIVVFLSHRAVSADATSSPDNAYLDLLLGDWQMSGILMGKPIEYRARGERVLQGGFLLLHMIDAQSPPKYEADLFLGSDATQHDVIAHWLDRFGAAGSRVVGTGTRVSDNLTITFPYLDGSFRNIFTYNAATKTWILAIDSQDKDGSWSSFATYTLRRPTPPSSH